MHAASVNLDGRNIYNPHYIKDLGFEYIGIGRGVDHAH